MSARPAPATALPLTRAILADLARTSVAPNDSTPTAVATAATLLSPTQQTELMGRIYEHGDRLVTRFICLHALLAFALAFFYQTWVVTVLITFCASAMFLVSAWLLPRAFLTRCLAGVSLQIFVALHIYQLHGLAEMHFFFFTAFTMLIVYQDWKCLWPGAIGIIGQHLAFALLHNAGLGASLYFFDEGFVGVTKLGFHFGIAFGQVGICGYWAYLLHQQTLASAVQNEGLRVMGVTANQNAEALRSAKEDAERANVAKDEFLATLSHELRTPLNAILGWTQVLRGEPGNVEDVEQGLATIERNARAQNQIIEDLLDMSRIISGKVRLDVQRMDLAPVLEATIETMRPAAAAKGIRLQTVLDPRGRPVSGDPSRLQQIFWNLLSNAIKFTPRGGRVQVVLERVHSHLEVSITDSGEGIAPEFLPHVFDRFRQADASITRRHGGLGLGLAIVKQLVELHGGTVRVHSEGLGEGATFCVMLPLTAVQSTVGDCAGELERRHPQVQVDALTVPVEFLKLDGVTVLVVDDEADARALVRHLLEGHDARVHTAGSVEEALELIESKRPDVLVSDIGMPQEDGYSLIRRVRALPAERGGNTPAIALTAYARTEDRLKAILAGFQIHAAKPVDVTELLALVANLAGKTRAAWETSAHCEAVLECGDTSPLLHGSAGLNRDTSRPDFPAQLAIG